MSKVEHLLVRVVLSIKEHHIQTGTTRSFSILWVMPSVLQLHHDAKQGG